MLHCRPEDYTILEVPTTDETLSKVSNHSILGFFSVLKTRRKIVMKNSDSLKKSFVHVTVKSVF